MTVHDITFRLPRSGLTLYGRRTNVHMGIPTLCLHGWLDNLSSFDPLFERLSDSNLIAVDLPGHGLSDPIPSVTCHYLDYVACVLELAHLEGWREFRLIGHSLGAGLSTLIAGIHPEKIERLVLIDAIGPLPADPDQARDNIGRYLNAYLARTPAPVYPTRAQAIRARVQLADILVDTAEKLVERDLIEVPGGYSWRSDVRLKYPSPLGFTEEQILAYLRNITAPTLLVRAERTALRESFYAQRISTVSELTQITLPGGHHLHMENPNAVAQVIHQFLNTSTRQSLTQQRTSL